MSDVRVVWTPFPVDEGATYMPHCYRLEPHGIDWVPGLYLPIERTEDGAVVVRVGEYVIGREAKGCPVFCYEGSVYGDLYDATPADAALLTAAERATEGENDG